MKRKIFAANWKLHKTPAEARRFFTELKPEAQNILAELLLFPPATSWEAASQVLTDSGIGWGAQNVWSQGQGAFTGENSAAVLREMGGRYVLIGHSERRQIFGEKDELLAEKLAYVQSIDLTAVLCIGETLPQREAGQTDEVNRRQLDIALSRADRAKKLIVAYEPVWAIGTGKVATSEQVRDAHARIHEHLEKSGFKGVPLLYGGSVKPDNAAGLLGLDHVDGFLIGGASLEVATYLTIARS